MYLISKFYFPKNYLLWMYSCLKVFTKENTQRPKYWLTGFEKKMNFKRKVEKY